MNHKSMLNVIIIARDSAAKSVIVKVNFTLVVHPIVAKVVDVSSVVSASPLCLMEVLYMVN